MRGRFGFRFRRSGRRLLGVAGPAYWPALCCCLLQAESFLISQALIQLHMSCRLRQADFPVQVSPLKPPARLALLVHRDSLTDPQWQESPGQSLTCTEPENLAASNCTSSLKDF